MELDWVKNINKIPFKIKRYAQFGEELLFEYIFKNIGETNRYLIDFGAGGLGCSLSNSLYLLSKGWTGLRMDGNPYGDTTIMQEMITAENICDLFVKYNAPKEFDLLSIDIDGNDYWVLENILKGGYSPRVIIAEFNGCLATNESKAIKYNPTHVYGDNDYYGFSFEAGRKLGIENGYTLICEVATTNMIFVRSDIVPQFDYKVNYTQCQYHKHSPDREWVNV